MMPVSIFVSRFGITDLVNRIKIHTNLIKLFNFEIYSIFIIAQRKSDANMHVFLCQWRNQVLIFGGSNFAKIGFINFNGGRLELI